MRSYCRFVIAQALDEISAKTTALPNVKEPKQDDTRYQGHPSVEVNI
jgi:hypothetical protein